MSCKLNSQFYKIVYIKYILRLMKTTEYVGSYAQFKLKNVKKVPNSAFANLYIKSSK